MSPPSPPRQRVLMLAYYFPPLGGGGVQRTLKHAKYLPSAGFDVIVVTGTGRGFPLRDPGLARELVPGTVVLRAPTLPLQIARWKTEGVLRRLGQPTWPASIIGWPDEIAGWLPGAVHQALRAVRRYRPDVLYTTSSPVTAHAAGLIVQRFTGLPWVADFRDPWTRHLYMPRQFRPMARASEALEQLVTRRVDRVVLADDSVTVLGVEAGDERTTIIRNGVDAEDLAGLDAAAPPAHFRLSHVGSLYGTIDGSPIFTALRNLLDRGALDRDSFELRFVGDADVKRHPLLADLPVTQTGYVDHDEALREMLSATALLLHRPSVTRASSGKVFEYLVTRRPVLCVAARDNLAYRLVEELGAGPCVEPEDAEGIERAITDLVADWRSGALGVDERVRDETLRRFSRRALAEQLGDVLRAAIADHAMN
jgi:glycosyltransferase involved in cell wall biosynthesis